VRDRWLLRRGLLAAFVSVAANLLLLRAGLAVADLPAMYRLDQPGPILVPLAATVAATSLYASLQRFTDRPEELYQRLVALGFVLSLAPIAVIAMDTRIELLGIGVLVTMHLVGATILAVAFRSRT
jgi:hypothetical protein